VSIGIREEINRLLVSHPSEVLQSYIIFDQLASILGFTNLMVWNFGHGGPRGLDLYTSRPLLL
jgi:hypothetical protein